MFLNNELHHRGVGQGGHVPQLIVLVGGNLSQDATHDLGRTCLRKARDNLYQGEESTVKSYQIASNHNSAYKEGLRDSKASNLLCNQLLQVLDYLILRISYTVLENHKGIDICRAE